MIGHPLCQKDCSSFDGCLGYHFYQHSRGYKCFLFPSKTTFTKCPVGGLLLNGTGFAMAETVEELVEGPDDGGYGYICSRRINKKTLQSW